jgi:hypothetical protein
MASQLTPTPDKIPNLGWRTNLDKCTIERPLSRFLRRLVTADLGAKRSFGVPKWLFVKWIIGGLASLAHPTGNWRGTALPDQRPSPRVKKVFCFFFFKKEALA